MRDPIGSKTYLVPGTLFFDSNVNETRRIDLRNSNTTSTQFCPRLGRISSVSLSEDRLDIVRDSKGFHRSRGFLF